MGIGITSNSGVSVSWKAPPEVSIPNGDRHYLEPESDQEMWSEMLFQSPMGIGITSNLVTTICIVVQNVSIPNGDRHYLEPYLGTGHVA